MASAELQSRAFTDEAAAREAMEALLWPNGPVCPHCGSFEEPRQGQGRVRAPRPLLLSQYCKSQFTVTIGTIFERSKVPLS